MGKIRLAGGVAAASLMVGLAGFASAQDRPPLNNYGGVGAIETRSARMSPDGDLSLNATLSGDFETSRYTLTFQPAPWMEASFRYGRFPYDAGALFDRSFDVKLRLMQEGPVNPEISVGLQDFLGTGVFSGEYLVASKRIGAFDLSAGLGWGRLGSRGGVDNPFRAISSSFGSRDTGFGLGGKVSVGNFFRGKEVAPFGSVIYNAPIDGLKFIAEWDGDASSGEYRGAKRSPVNLGVVYSPFETMEVAASLLGGEDVMLRVAIRDSVSQPYPHPRLSPRPAPFASRKGDLVAPSADGLLPPRGPLQSQPTSGDQLFAALSNELAAQGIALERVAVDGADAQVHARNLEFRAAPQALGRIVRALSRYAPDAVERFHVVLTERGVAMSETTFARADLEGGLAEEGGVSGLPVLADVHRMNAPRKLGGAVTEPSAYPRFDWSFGPDLSLGLFDPDAPLRFAGRAVGRAEALLAPGLRISGQAGVELFGNLSNIARRSNSVLPHVRTDVAEYFAGSPFGVDTLKASYLFRPADNVYAQVSGGYLETMYGGVGAEALWRPDNSRLSLGAEAFWVKQRDFDRLFGFRDYDTATGHVSLYYDSPFYNWDVAIHAGRYLAKDWGVTLEASRRFANGWEVGAFATFTDVPFDKFGEGSFDKGIKLSMPLDSLLPWNTRGGVQMTVRSILRDGGARLNLSDRLYDVTRPTGAADMRVQWPLFQE